MKIKSTLFALFIFIGTQLFAQDAYLTDLSIGNYLKVNNSYNISIDIQNNSETGFDSCTVSWQLTGGSVNTDQVSWNGDLVTNEYVAYTFSSSLTLPSAGNYVLKVWVTVSGDTDDSNDTLTQNIIGLTSYVQSNVLVEELTGTWCPHCPPGMIAIDSIAQNPYAVVASFHGGGNGDPFIFTVGEAHMDTYFPTSESYFPSAIVNMGEMGAYAINSYTTNWQADAESQIGISPVALTVTAGYTGSTQQLTVTVTANFKYALTGDFYLNAYVLQNNIAGTQDSSDYLVPWVYNHVARAMLGGQNGTGAVIPSSPALNTDYSKTYTMTIPSAWNVTDIKDIDIDGIVFQQSGVNTNALNAAKYSFATVGVNNIASEHGNIHIFPNPIRSSASIAVTGVTGKINYTFMLYDVLGNEVKRMPIQNNVTVLKRDNLSSGIYFYNIISNEGTTIGNGKLIMAD